ncbi:proline-rich nuclear receptor coactivator 2 [Nasonia vitripennis]|uniref:Proline-rich nuclear receptor coactivator 2 n=1 Tax=Nasonia vitripennis TaxID=7425 RepID=A0A7M7PYC8_NASVI|nr:proline-rich nuclear receptor coactivator 2 [Nasonia vitripennis]
MTNSTPKNNDKIERQGSPSSQGKQRRSSNYVKTVTYFSSGNNNAAGAGSVAVNGNNASGRNSRASNSSRRQSCSPPCTSAKNIPRSSPMRYDSPRGSPTNNFYAGAKFSEPPSPASLPKPPNHWTGLIVSCGSETGPSHISQHFNMFLNIQA